MTDENVDIFADLEADGGEPEVTTVEDLNFVTVRTAGGTSVDVPGIDQPTSVAEIMDLAHIGLTADVALFVDGVAVARDFQVGPGATITLLALQKGG